jgi:hypothetical protein
MHADGVLMMNKRLMNLVPTQQDQIGQAKI